MTDEPVKVQYVTCPQHHKVYVVWIDSKKQFAFCCDECGETSGVAVSLHGPVWLTRYREAKATQ